jgi:hypothetical protein
VTADVERLLDALDQAHAAATPGPWFEVGYGIYAEKGERGDAGNEFAAQRDHECLVAALRAVLEICAAWEEEARQWLDQAARNEADGFGMTAAAQRENASDALLRADHVRSAVVAALGVETTEAGR